MKTNKKVLGIELGSTRIKAVLIDQNGKVLASGGFDWENKFIDGHWTYSMEQVFTGIKVAYAKLIENYGEIVTKLDAIGVSAMMHGYLPFNSDGELLANFRTWRDTTTLEASEILTNALKFNMPQRWSATHYYQSILNGESHVKDVDFLTTLSGYVHYKLTGNKVLGIDDASGMFPVKDGDYDKEKISEYNRLLLEKGIDKDLYKLLPKVLKAGEFAGVLTEEGAKLLDPNGNLCSGIKLCPPEGDMGTGIIATNTVAPRSANVSAGTSANLTVVLDKSLSNYYKEIDVIATPDGYPCALVHTNNCTTEINEWVNLFGEVLSLYGINPDKADLFSKLFNLSLDSSENVGGLTAYNYLAGETLAKTDKGAPLIIRNPEYKMSLADFMQAQIYSAIATIELGMDILQNEGVKIDKVLAHGGYYKTPKIGQKATSALLKAPVTVMQTAGEGGAWGMAILALYSTIEGKSLSEFTDEIFLNEPKTIVTAEEKDVKTFNNFIKNYKKLLEVEKNASRLI